MFLSHMEASKIYDILILHAGALPKDKDNFIQNVTLNKYNEYECREWIFQGKLGFGGKYRPETNSVDCYNEDLTKERINIINKVNSMLSLIRPTESNTQIMDYSFLERME